MNDSKISVRYAKALFQAALEERTLDKVKKDIFFIEEVLKVERYMAMLINPVITTTEKKKITKEIFEKNVEKLTFDFLNLLLKNQRESYIEGIIRNFQKYYRENKGIKAAEMITAFSIDKAYKERFRQILEMAFESDIEFKELVNPKLIGGFVLKVEDEQYDASVSTSLSKIRKIFIETPIEKS